MSLARVYENSRFAKQSSDFRPEDSHACITSYGNSFPATQECVRQSAVQ